MTRKIDYKRMTDEDLDEHFSEIMSVRTKRRNDKMTYEERAERGRKSYAKRMEGKSLEEIRAYHSAMGKKGGRPKQDA